MNTVRDALRAVKEVEINNELFGISRKMNIQYKRLVRALSDSILAEAGLKRGKAVPRETVLDSDAEKKFTELKDWVSKFIFPASR